MIFRASVRLLMGKLCYPKDGEVVDPPVLHPTFVPLDEEARQAFQKAFGKDVQVEERKKEHEVQSVQEPRRKASRSKRQPY